MLAAEQNAGVLAECAVFTLADERLGKAVRAVVVLLPDGRINPTLAGQASSLGG